LEIDGEEVETNRYSIITPSLVSPLPMTNAVEVNRP